MARLFGLHGVLPRRSRVTLPLPVISRLTKLVFTASDQDGNSLVVSLDRDASAFKELLVATYFEDSKRHFGAS